MLPADYGKNDDVSHLIADAEPRPISVDEASPGALLGDYISATQHNPREELRFNGRMHTRRVNPAGTSIWAPPYAKEAFQLEKIADAYHATNRVNTHISIRRVCIGNVTIATFQC